MARFDLLDALYMSVGAYLSYSAFPDSRLKMIGTFLCQICVSKLIRRVTGWRDVVDERSIARLRQIQADKVADGGGSGVAVATGDARRRKKHGKRGKR